MQVGVTMFSEPKVRRDILNSTSFSLWFLCLFRSMDMLILYICLSDDTFKDCSVTNKC